MNLRDLEYFITVAELKHFGQAAEKLFVSQPTLSMQIKKLEKTLGVPLFERSNRTVHLTNAGQLLLEQAHHIVQDAKALKITAKQYQNPYESTIKLGVTPTVAPYFLPILLPMLNVHFPKLRLEVNELKTHEIIAELESHALDFGMLALPIQHDRLISLPLFKEPFLLALPQAHPPFKKFSDLADLPLLLLDEGHCLRDQALSFCHRHNIHETNLRASSLETLRALVSNGMGYTFMPKMAVRHDTGIQYQELKDAPLREIGFIFRKTSPLQGLLNDIGQHL